MYSHVLNVSQVYLIFFYIQYTVRNLYIIINVHFLNKFMIMVINQSVGYIYKTINSFIYQNIA